MGPKNPEKGVSIVAPMGSMYQRIRSCGQATPSTYQGNTPLRKDEENQSIPHACDHTSRAGWPIRCPVCQDGKRRKKERVAEKIMARMCDLVFGMEITDESFNGSSSGHMALVREVVLPPKPLRAEDYRQE